MLSIQEIEKICNTRFNCKVQDRGFGTHAQGKREIHIIVGKKINPGYDPNHLNPEIKKNPKYIPDVRIKFIDPSATEDDIFASIENIKNTLPEEREIIVDNKIAGIGQLEVKEPIIEPKATEKVITEEEHPADKKEMDKNDVIMGALDDIANLIGNLTKRMEVLEGNVNEVGNVKEEKRKQGRPRKVIEGEIKM